MYIRGTGCVSPQQTADGSGFLEEVRTYQTSRLPVIDPDYKQWIDIKLIRRMSRVIKMGVAASQLSLQEAGIQSPTAIITGTAYGCLADTGVFLNKMVAQEEQMLTPTAFIQSTHNTVAGQIALMLSCHGYNNTFVHRGFSFENALLDTMLTLQENPTAQILTGGVDEITDQSHAILERFGLYKSSNIDTTNILHSETKGTINGEGAAFFVLSGEKGDNAVATIDAMATLYKPTDVYERMNFCADFLSKNNIEPTAVDVILTGRNGDFSSDLSYDHIESSYFPGATIACFKHLCGEYPTASSFGVYAAVQMLKAGEVPPAMLFGEAKHKQVKKVLLYNHHNNTHHSFILLSVC